MKRHWPLVAIASGILLFIGGFAYDAIFAGIPHQDPTPELSARYAFHSLVAGIILWGGIGVFILGGIAGIVRYICRKSPEPKHNDSLQQDELAEKWFEQKSQLMETSLGKEHDTVMHAIVPYFLGGGLDLYYYPNKIPGTAIATKELSEIPNNGPLNNAYNSYEFVMFTKHNLNIESAQDATSEFGKIHATINMILNMMARYCEQATLNPYETCEFPEDMEHVGGKCLIFDGYACHSNEIADKFGLMAIIEIFRSEMDYARQHGGEKLLTLLKNKGYYPYSDLDRQPVA